MSYKDTAPIDFEALFRVWAYTVYLKSKGHAKKVKKFKRTCKIPDDLIIEFTWENATFEFYGLETTEKGNRVIPKQVHQMRYYSDISKIQPKISHNSTTEATFEVTVVEGRTSGLGVEPQPLHLPRALSSMPNSPFGNMFPLSTDARQIPSERRQQPWSFNAKFELEKDVHALATMMVHENHRQGDFKCTARLSGKLSAKVSKRKGGAPTIIDAADFPAIYAVFKSSVISVQSVNQLRVNREEKSLDWTVVGDFSLIYGLDNSYEVTKGDSGKGEATKQQ
ncbi:unnamed protein product [Lymnaea stagnalis]|uniref:Uncharacterized protein n=1 Tax=Lymnaea stagnalis TaxID=6523 RepID=A0AAV2H6S6_LYMST